MEAAPFRMGACLVVALVAPLIGVPGAATAADSTPPSGLGAATPTIVEQGATVTMAVRVTPGTEPASTGLAVSADLTSIGGSSSQQLYDDATHGDLVAGDKLFMVEATVAASTPTGFKRLPATISDAEGRSGSATISFSVITAVGATNNPPIVSAGGPYSVAEGSSTQLAAGGSDPDADALTYAWDLDDDGTFETPGQMVTFSAAALDGPSSHTVAVRISDGLASATSQARLTVTNVAPTATFSTPSAAVVGHGFALALSSPADPSAADVAAGFEYAFDCGSGYGAFGSSPTASCAATGAGTLSVGAVIRDKDGDVTEYRATVQVGVTFDGLCQLVRAYSTDPKVAADLCHKLDDAANAPTAAARAGMLNAFRNQVDAKVDSGLTAEQAAELKLLSKQL